MQSQHPYQHPQGEPNYQGNPFANQPMFGARREVPNATMTLVLGICSIVICALGPVLAIVGLVMSSKPARDYNANPDQYDTNSYNQLNAGRVCCIIGLVVGMIAWALIAYYFIMMYMAMQAATEILNSMPPPY